MTGGRWVALGLDMRVPGRRHKQTAAYQGADIWKPPANQKRKFAELFAGTAWKPHRIATAERNYICIVCGKYSKKRAGVTSSPCPGRVNVINVYAWSLLRGYPKPMLEEGRNEEARAQDSELLELRRVGLS